MFNIWTWRRLCQDWFGSVWSMNINAGHNYVTTDSSDLLLPEKSQGMNSVSKTLLKLNLSTVETFPTGGVCTCKEICNNYRRLTHNLSRIMAYILSLPHLSYIPFSLYHICRNLWHCLSYWQSGKSDKQVSIGTPNRSARSPVILARFFTLNKSA